MTDQPDEQVMDALQLLSHALANALAIRVDGDRRMIAEFFLTARMTIAFPDITEQVGLAVKPEQYRRKVHETAVAFLNNIQQLAESAARRCRRAPYTSDQEIDAERAEGGLG